MPKRAAAILQDRRAEIIELTARETGRLGRFNSRWIVDEYTRTHWVTLQRQPRPYPFA